MSETVRLYKTGGHQALKLPHGFELPGKEATVRRVGNTLVLEAKAEKPADAPKTLGDVLDRVHRINMEYERRETSGLLAYLADKEPLDEEFPDVDEGLLPLEDVEL
jgi:antitoxin VapB